MRSVLTVCTVAGGIVVFSGAALGETVSYSFTRITNNAPVNIANQLRLSVSDASQTGGIISANQVSFMFRDGGPSSIAGVYYEDNLALLSLARINVPPGVSFMQSDVPPPLPGGEAVDFNTTMGVLAQPTCPTGPDGDGEWLELVFTLHDGGTFGEAIAAMSSGTDLRVGMFIRDMMQGSDSFVSRGVHLVPLPSAAFMAGVGMLAIGVRRRR